MLGRYSTRDIGKYVAGRIAGTLHRVVGGRGRSGILVYHRIADETPGLTPPTWNASPASFRSQIEGLLEAGVRFVRVSELVGRTRPFRTRNVAVTFDDVYGSAVSRAAPILRELGVPATFFVSTAYVGSVDLFPFEDWEDAARAPFEDVRPPTFEEIAELQEDPLFEVGAHTHTHDDFRDSPDALAEDLQANLDWLQTQLGIEEPPFAFPYGRTAYGYAGGELAETVRELPVSCAVTTDPDVFDPKGDPYEWPRFNVYDWDDAASILAKLDGRYSWAPRLIERAAS